MIPSGAATIIEARKAGQKPAEGVVVSFVGRTDLEGPHVYPRSGEEYDWRFLRDLQIVVVVKPGIDAGPALRGIFAEAIVSTGYPWVVDLDRKSLASLIDARPLRLWPVSKGTPNWKAFFE